MNNLSRRNALGLMAAAPMAGSEIAKRITSDPPRYVGYGFSDALASARYVSRPQITADLMRGIGIPDWMRRGWKRQAQQVRSFEPDIDAMKSMSTSAKVFAQRKRNLENAEQRFWDQLLFQDEQAEIKAWYEKHGCLNFIV